MVMSKLLAFCEGRMNSVEVGFFCFAFTCLTILLTTTFNNLLDASVIKTLVVVGLTILHFSMEYWMQT